jgi:hypothetical protein
MTGKASEDTGCNNLSFTGSGTASHAKTMPTGNSTESVSQICKCLFRNGLIITGLFNSLQPSSQKERPENSYPRNDDDPESNRATMGRLIYFVYTFYYKEDGKKKSEA